MTPTLVSNSKSLPPPSAPDDSEIGVYIMCVRDSVAQLTIGIAALENRLASVLSSSTPCKDSEANLPIYKTRIGSVIAEWNTAIQSLRDRVENLYSRIELPRT